MWQHMLRCAKRCVVSLVMSSLWVLSVCCGCLQRVSKGLTEPYDRLVPSLTKHPEVESKRANVSTFEFFEHKINHCDVAVRASLVPANLFRHLWCLLWPSFRGARKTSQMKMRTHKQRLCVLLCGVTETLVLPPIPLPLP